MKKPWRLTRSSARMNMMCGLEEACTFATKQTTETIIILSNFMI